MSKRHELKTETKYYQAIEQRLKMFEVRKNDRDFKVDDILDLREICGNVPTGRSIKFGIAYILEGGQFGIDKGYCVMQLRPLK